MLGIANYASKSHFRYAASGTHCHSLSLSLTAITHSLHSAQAVATNNGKCELAPTVDGRPLAGSLGQGSSTQHAAPCSKLSAS